MELGGAGASACQLEFGHFCRVRGGTLRGTERDDRFLSSASLPIVGQDFIPRADFQSAKPPFRLRTVDYPEPEKSYALAIHRRPLSEAAPVFLKGELTLVLHLLQRKLDRQAKPRKPALQRHQLIRHRHRVRSPREKEQQLRRRIPRPREQVSTPDDRVDPCAPVGCPPGSPASMPSFGLAVASLGFDFGGAINGSPRSRIA